MIETARAVAAAALGRDPGPLTTEASLSHHVFVGADVVVKIIAADGHSRLNREIALAPHLPAGVNAPLLGSGLADGFRYACYARMPGKSPGMHLLGVDAATARMLAGEAIPRLAKLHAWTPAPEAAQTLRETLDHGGFVGRAEFVAELERLATADRDKVVPGPVLDGLNEIADRSPLHAGATVPVHADCHWGNWLADGPHVTALLDFEWARFGEPVDDWVFLIRFSGPHMATVLDLVVEATAIPEDVLRAECEVREASYLASDLRISLEHREPVDELLADLDGLVIRRHWQA